MMLITTQTTKLFRLIGAWCHVCCSIFVVFNLGQLIGPWCHVCCSILVVSNLGQLIGPWCHVCCSILVVSNLDQLIGPWCHVCCSILVVSNLDQLPVWHRFTDGLSDRLRCITPTDRLACSKDVHHFKLTLQLI